MTNLLILGGTTEANALAKAVAEQGIAAVYSYAGRVEHPRPQPLPMRVGGFGGGEGLVEYIRENKVTHLVDATHPFAARMSGNAIEACQATQTSLAALTRPAWTPQLGDNWRHAPDITAAVEALAGDPLRVFLAVGRMHLLEFSAQPQHHYLLRLVDEPDSLPLPNAEVVVARGPFAEAEDRALLQRHDTQLVVSKNAGGSGARAKLDAARALGLPVLMIDRPVLPQRTEFSTIAQVLDWVSHP
ncbi:cobalt-precorrin-6A reductase [uncultured Ruegeria sp.]|uniref:cobalt-precorrin-6A reductase n=1 Tax=uncultured Ruegeria sp. TaxID=259304 RepID=UPI00260EBBE7|nr:cobalt-precorrin-6A reductase [uncultured Ruegeria sp.]